MPMAIWEQGKMQVGQDGVGNGVQAFTCGASGWEAGCREGQGAGILGCDEGPGQVTHARCNLGRVGGSGRGGGQGKGVRVFEVQCSWEFARMVGCM